MSSLPNWLFIHHTASSMKGKGPYSRDLAKFIAWFYALSGLALGVGIFVIAIRYENIPFLGISIFILILCVARFISLIRAVSR